LASSGENTPEPMAFRASCRRGEAAISPAMDSSPACLRASTCWAVRPKMNRFSRPMRSDISTLAPSRVPMVSAPFKANFMLLVPEASRPAVEICSDRSAAGMMASARLTL
jgi:hypothetical protein